MPELEDSVFFLSCLLIYVWAIVMLHLARRMLTPMYGMTAAMILGMGGGIQLGTFLGLLAPDSLIRVNVLSMFLGLIIGALAGRPTGWISVMNGMGAGWMGGMMGAMLGVMVDSSERGMTLKIITVMAFGLVLITMYGAFKSSNADFLSSPWPLVILMMLAMIMAEAQAERLGDTSSHHHSWHKEKDPCERI